MRTQGWKRIVKFAASITLATLLSGCHAVHSGAPHPFTTMFRQSAEVNRYADPTESIQANARPTLQDDMPGDS